MCDVVIEMGEDAKAESPEIICSGGMGPCISIGIYDPIGKCGYMRHQHAPDNDDDMKDFIIETLAQCSNPNDLKVFVAGGAEGEHAEDVLESRTYIEELLSEHFTKNQIRIQWSKYDATTELTLDTRNGEFKVRDCNKPKKKNDNELDPDELWANL